MIKKIISILLIGTLSLIFAGCGDSIDEQGNLLKVTIGGVSSKVSDQSLAKAKKYFEEQFGDIDVKYVEYETGKDCVEALNARQIDFAYVGTASALYGLSMGSAMQVIWNDQIIDKSEALVVKENAKINKLADIKGKKIATPKNSTCEYFTREGLERVGLKESDYDLITMEPKEIVKAWQNGEIAGAAVWNPFLKQLVEDGGKTMYTAGQAAKNGVTTLDVTIANTDFLYAYPECAVKYIKACNKAVELYKTDKDEAIKALSESMDLSQDKIRAVIDDSIWIDGKTQLKNQYNQAKSLKKSFYNMSEFLFENKYIKQEPKETDFMYTMDYSYLEKALKE